MFNLDQAIVEWRCELAATGLNHPKILDELEAHLREEAEHQMRSGLEASQAFEAAVRRLGRIESLQQEFLKVRRESKWLSGLRLVIGGIFIAFIVWLSAITFYQSEFSVVGQTLGMAAVSLTLAVGCFWRRALGVVPLIEPKWRRVAALMGFLLSFGFIFAVGQLVAPPLTHYSYEAGLLILFWAMLPTTMIFCFGLALAMPDEARRRRGMFAKNRNIQPV